MPRPTDLTPDQLLAMPSGTALLSRNLDNPTAAPELHHIWCGTNSDMPGDFQIIGVDKPHHSFNHRYSHATYDPPRRLLDNAAEDFLDTHDVLEVAAPDQTNYHRAAHLVARHRAAHGQWCTCEYDYADRLPGATTGDPDGRLRPQAIDLACPTHGINLDLEAL